MKLYKKYAVYRIGDSRFWQSVDTKNVDSPFVLMPRKDPAAMLALECYADSCEPELRREIKHWIQRIKRAPKILGTQGRRNKRFAG